MFKKISGIMTSEYTGIEIGRDVLRIASVQADRSGARIIEAFSHELDVPFSPDCLEKILPSIIEGRISANSPVLISISPNLTSFRRIGLPFSSESKIRQVLASEIEPLIPFQSDQIQTTFVKIPQRNGEKTTSLIVCSMDGDEMGTIISSFRRAGLDVIGLTVSGYASAASHCCYLRQGLYENDDAVVFADLGDDCLTISIIRSGNIEFIRPVGLGKNISAEPSWILDEVFRTIIYYSDYYDPDISVTALNILRSGSKSGYDRGNAWMEEMARLCSLKDISFKLLEPEQKEYANIFSAISLYVSGKSFLNFIDSGFFRFGVIKDIRKNWTASLIMAGCVLLSALFYLCVSEYVSYKAVKALDSEIRKVFMETFPETKKIVDPYQQMSVKVKSLVQDKGDGPERGSVMDILREISQKIKPEMDLTITNLTVLPDEIKINGESSSFDMVENARKSLSESNMFRDVKVDSVNSDSKSGKVVFKLNLGRGQL